MSLQLYNDRRWCVLHTRARHEKKVAKVCTTLDLPHYLPLHIHQTFSGGKVNTFQLPMFPGYVFAALALGDLLHLKRTNSVARKIDTLDENGLLADLTNIRKVEVAQLELETIGRFRQGQHVQVIAGPLTGVVGSVLRYKNRTRLQIVVSAIQQAILVDVPRDALIPLTTE